MRWTLLGLTLGLLQVTAPVAEAQDKLADRVKRHGGPLEVLHIVEYSPAELRDLVRGSRLVIHAVVNKSSSRLSRDEREIETDYSLSVLEVFRGPANLVGTRIDVTRHGGTLQVEGHTIVATETEFPAFLVGEEYVLCLEPSLIDGRYRVNYGGQGAFRINEGIAEQLSKPDDRPNLTIERLVQQIRALSK